MARRKKIKTEKTRIKKEKKKKKRDNQSTAGQSGQAWPGLVWSYHFRGSHCVGRGVDRYAVRERGEETVIRGGNGMAVMAQHRELACVGCLTEVLTD